jgi:putative protein kinase ArgK-like GTPase of G3E family
VKTVATDGRGIDELVEAVDRCWQFFHDSPARSEKKRDAARQRLMTLLEERLVATAVQAVFRNGELSKVIDEIAERRKDPYSWIKLSKHPNSNHSNED